MGVQSRLEVILFSIKFDPMKLLNVYVIQWYRDSEIIALVTDRISLILIFTFYIHLDILKVYGVI
jgi:hypothetical protein